jgi:hypothetical protein
MLLVMDHYSGVIVLATHYKAVFEAMDAAGGPPVFAGKTTIDINNPVPGVFDK